ncbi:MAG: hypothetical protein K2Q01_04740, partial [Rickettsiales bacterium]|nr:hypothetical protein [Rickettsiales bacterium]
IGRNSAIIRHDLDLPEEIYKGDAFHAELAVKIIEMKAMNQWTQGHERRYPHLSRFVDLIVAKDVTDWEQSQEQNKTYHVSNHPLNAAAYRAAMPPVAAKQDYPV